MLHFAERHIISHAMMYSSNFNLSLVRVQFVNPCIIDHNSPAIFLVATIRFWSISRGVGLGGTSLYINIYSIQARHKKYRTASTNWYGNIKQKIEHCYLYKYKWIHKEIPPHRRKVHIKMSVQYFHEVSSMPCTICV